jgi:hypothetical protein
MKKKRMPMSWHVAVGLFMRETRADLSYALTSLGHEYPLNNKALKAIERAYHAVDKARDELDMQFSREHWGDDKPELYWGAIESRIKKQVELLPEDE